MFIADGKHLLQNKALILQHIKPVDPLAKVQVSQVQKLHRYFSKPRLQGMQGGVTSPRRNRFVGGGIAAPYIHPTYFSLTATISPTW